MFKFRWPALFALACTVLFCSVAFAADAPPPDATMLGAALFAHKWVVVATIVIGLVVRMLKEDVTFVPTLPSRWRPLLALGLGIVAGFLMKLQPGTSWPTALLDGGLSAFLAMGGHAIIVDALRGGRDLGVAKVPADAAPTTKLPPDPPSGPSAGAVLTVLLFIGALGLLGAQPACTPATRRQAANTALDVAQVGCIVANMWLDVPAIAQVCSISDKLLPDLRAIVSSMRTSAMAGAPLCAADGGVCLPKDAGAE